MALELQVTNFVSDTLNKNIFTLFCFVFFLFSFTFLSKLFQLILDRPVSRWGDNGWTARKKTHQARTVAKFVSYVPDWELNPHKYLLQLSNILLQLSAS